MLIITHTSVRKLLCTFTKNMTVGPSWVPHLLRASFQHTKVGYIQEATNEYINIQHTNVCVSLSLSLSLKSIFFKEWDSSPSDQLKSELNS